MKNFSVAASVEIFLVGALSVFWCPTLASAEQYPDLIMHGESYPNICKPSEREAFSHIILNSDATDIEGAWRAISTILCSPRSKVGRSYIDGLLPKIVRKHLSSTGDKDVVKKVARSDALIDEIMAEGKAWNVELRTEPKQITLQYFENEACLREVVLSRGSGKWLISEISEACD